MREYHLKTPIGEEEIRGLRVGDILYISGIIITARDEAHRRALEYKRMGRRIPVEFSGKALYHCGPLVERVDGEWRVIVGGPTTSARMEALEPSFIEEFGVRVVIGKGGMGKGTAEAMERFGAVYAAFTGGAAVIAAKAIKKVVGVEWLDLGMPEALWILEVEEFGPLTVAIDSHGKNLYEEVLERAEDRRKFIYSRIDLDTT